MRYTREDGCRAWLTHGLMHPETVLRLMREHEGAEGVYERFMRSGSSFLKAYQVSDASIKALSTHADANAMHQMMVLMQKQNLGIMSLDDDRYPDLLRQIQLPPALMFYQGNTDCLMGKCITVIGSRSASPHALEVTRRLARELSQVGVTIVSGMAMGVDAAAHNGCLQGGSPTAAVLACGLDMEYPIENIRLRQRCVEEGGVALSEYPIGFHASKYTFHMRNRIMSGLSRALVVTEARIRSGSMITVQHALDQGREVFAYPGIPGSEWSEGAHQLLREGANYFTSAQDILEDMGWEDAIPASTSPTMQQPARAVKLPEMTQEQRRIYVLLGEGEMSFDELAFRSGLPVPTLSTALTMLQMVGAIKAMPGKTYCRN